MNNDTIITIGRQYGSGGREIGRRLSAELNIPFYDKELLAIASKESGISQQLFESNDEKPNNSFLYSLVMGNYGTTDLPLNHKIFLAQFDAIRKIAQEGSCIIVGRCADYALEQNFNAVNVFIHADMKTKIERVIQFHGVPEDKAEETILKTDKQRAKYYNFYASKKWGNVDNYDLTINSGTIGIDNAVSLIKAFVNFKHNM